MTAVVKLCLWLGLTVVVDAATCNLNGIYSGRDVCNERCCGSESCNCVQHLIDNGVDNGNGNVGVDVVQFCVYTDCLNNVVSGCPDEIATYAGVAAINDWVNTDSQGDYPSRMAFCEALPCHWTNYDKFDQCLRLSDCIIVPGQEQCSQTCVDTLLRCMSSSSCTQLYSTKDLCMHEQGRQNCTAVCDVLFPDTQAPSPSAPPSGGGDATIVIIIVVVSVIVVAGVGVVAGVVYYQRANKKVTNAPLSPEVQEVNPVNPMHPSMAGSAFQWTDQSIVQQLMKKNWQKGTLLGRGNFGSVYLALLGGGQQLAVKQIDASAQDEEDTQDLIREIGVMRDLDHPNVVRYYYASFDDADKMINIFMEYVPGGSLAKLVRGMDCNLGVDQARAYTQQILQGLEYLHSHKIVHRDIKGDNVLIDATGVCKITDFGTAKKMEGQTMAPQQHGTMAGTPNWMAPEIITNAAEGVGKQGEKADVWSVGCTVVELLNRGTPPWPQFTTQWAAIYHIAQATDTPEGIPEDLPEVCREFVLRCLTRDPEARPNVKECLQHPWMVGNDQDAVEACRVDSGSASQPVREDEGIRQMMAAQRTDVSTDAGGSVLAASIADTPKQTPRADPVELGSASDSVKKADGSSGPANPQKNASATSIDVLPKTVN